MAKSARVITALVAITAATLAVAGCSSTKTASGSSAAFNAAVSGIVNPSTKTGGTLKLGATSDCDSWDPKIAYYGWCWNMQRLFTRSLIGYSVVNGTQFVLAPDLATDMGTHNADFTQWTYTLKPGLKWSTGQPITPMDVKYGIERNFASAELSGGPSSYFTQGIKAAKDYAGPYKDGDLPDTDISTTANTITINLTSPNSDFNYLMAMSAAAPVPYKVEGGPGFVGANYTKHPVSSGPFMVKSYTPDNAIDFVRNPNWNQSTDTIRHPLLDEVDLTFDSNPVDLDQKLQAGTLDANAASGAGGLTPAFQSYVLTHPDAKKHTDDPTSGTEYFAVMQSIVTNADCRKAIFYAMNKASVLAAEGGATAGMLAGSMTPPGIPGFDSAYNPYPTGPDNTGDLAMAKQELQKCGKPNGFPLVMAYATPSTKAKAVFESVQQALGRVGITVTGVTDASKTYYNTFIGSPKLITTRHIGLALAGWGADFPTVVGFYQAIANGNAIVDPGNSNYPSLNDPIVNKIIDNATSGTEGPSDYANLNHQVMNDAVYLPAYWGSVLMWRSARMTNVTCDNALAFGNYDFVNVGVG